MPAFCFSDSFGVKLREDIERKILKWKEPPPAKQEKPLPAPDDRPRKRRGGKRCASPAGTMSVVAPEVLLGTNVELTEIEFMETRKCGVTITK